MSVHWLQGLSWFCGLRIPAGFSFPSGARAFSELSDEAIMSLATIQGSAGRLHATSETCLWTSAIGRHPPAKLPDEARYAIDDDTLVEDGIHFDYREVWKRDPRSDGPRLTFALTDDAAGRAGVLIVAGDIFMAVVAGPTPPPASGALEDAVAAALRAGARQRAADLLSTSSSMGSVSEGWSISLSTHPWMQGRSIWQGPPAIRRGPDEIAVLGDGRQTWRLIESSASGAEFADFEAGLGRGGIIFSGDDHASAIPPDP